MAAASSGVWLPIFRAKSPEGCRRLARMFIIGKRDSSSASTDIPLLQKLLKSQVSRIKETLDSEVISEANEFPWAALLSSLNSSAPHKANLVIEWKLGKLIKENPKNQDSYSQLISLCSNIRNLPIAMLIFTSMEAQGVQPTPSIFNALISTGLSSGNLLTALSLFEIMEGSESYKPDSHTYNAFILAYSNMGNKNATESWFAAKRACGFSPDVLTYGSLIQCCVKSNHFEDAQRYFEEMMLAGVNPNEPVMQNMLLMYCKQRNCVGVKEILKFALNGNWQIDQSMAKKVVSLYQELGRVEELEELLVTLAESNQTSEVLSLVHCSIIRFYAETDRLDDVEYSVGRMLKNEISFSCSEDVEKVICCYFRREAYDRLELFLECIRDSYKFTRSNYDLLCAGYKRAGSLERLNVVVNEMKVAGFV